MRSKDELLQFLDFLKLHRKTYLKSHGRASSYSRKIHHYIRALMFVLNPEQVGVKELGATWIFLDSDPKASYIYYEDLQKKLREIVDE